MYLGGARLGGVWLGRVRWVLVRLGSCGEVRMECAVGAVRNGLVAYCTEWLGPSGLEWSGPVCSHGLPWRGRVVVVLMVRCVDEGGELGSGMAGMSRQLRHDAVRTGLVRLLRFLP